MIQLNIQTDSTTTEAKVFSGKYNQISLARRGHHISFISTPGNIQRLPKVPLDIAHLISFIPLHHISFISTSFLSSPQIDSTEFQLCVMTSTSSAITKTHKN